MPHIVICCHCGNKIVKSNRRYNEEKKHGWKPYCSLICLGLSRRASREFVCSRPGCNKRFIRKRSDYKRTIFHYCSHRCQALVVNSKRIPKPRKKCRICDSYLKCGKIYCSTKCQRIGAVFPKDKIIEEIHKFFKKNGRIPFKSEFEHHHSARNQFGTWNNAIIAAGYEPNPVRFAKKYVAKDGHVCDSMAEKIIDDWLFKRNIKHRINVPYPGNKGYTVDFRVGNKWIEYFGLSGELKRYDVLKRRKIKLAKEFKLDLVKIYPNDLFSKPKFNKKMILIHQNG